MGYEDKRESNDYILVPNRTIKSKTISNQLSKSFSHYRNQCGVSKSLSLKHLRKTYIYLFNDNRKITDLIFHYDLKNIITRNKIFSF